MVRTTDETRRFLNRWNLRLSNVIRFITIGKQVNFRMSVTVNNCTSKLNRLSHEDFKIISQTENFKKLMRLI